MPIDPPRSSPAPAPWLRATLLRSLAQFSVATVASQLAGLLRAYAIGHALGVTAAGVWIGLQLVVSYAVNASLGVNYGMHRTVPLLRGRGQEAEVRVVERTAFTFTLITGLLCFGVAAAAALGLLRPLEGLLDARRAALLGQLRDPALRPVVMALAAVLPVNLLKSYYVTLFRAHNRFREASLGSLIGSLAGVASLLLIRPFGLVGVVWGLFGLVAGEVLYLAWRAGPPGLGLSPTVLRDQLAIGLLTVAVTVVATLLGTVDRTVLLGHFSAEGRGYYYPAFLAGTFFGGLSAVPNAVLYPRLTELYGRTGEPASMVRLLARPLRMMAAAGALVAAAAMVGAPALLRLLLPSFEPGARATQVAMAGLACFVVAQVSGNVFVALNRQWTYLALLATSTAVSYALTRAAVHLHPDIVGVAIGATAGYLVHAALLTYAGYRAMEQPAATALRAVGALLVPFGLAFGLAAGVLAVIERGFGAATLAGGVTGEVAVLLLGGPLAALSIRREWRR